MTTRIATIERDALDSLREEVSRHVGESPHDGLARIVVASAIETGLEGNAAVAALLAGPAGEVILSRRNQMFAPSFRSDLHAEMVLLNAFEDSNAPDPDLRGLTLVTSLEPCEMCMIRIINSGVTTVLYVAEDRGKGAITGPNRLAPHWARLAEPQTFAAAQCDPRLAEIALSAFEITIGGVTRRLMARRLGERGPK